MILEVLGLPVSSNQSLIASGNRLIHSTAARNYRTQTELGIQNQIDQQLRLDPSVGFELMQMIGEPLFCHIKYYSNWSTKTGTIRKKDLANLEKLLIDSIISVFNANGYTIDDSAFYLLLLTKHDIDAPENHEKQEKTVIYIDSLANFSIG